jgi:hypothetical protein
LLLVEMKPLALTALEEIGIDFGIETLAAESK